MRHTATILDIARELGISKSTVSRALSGHPSVKPDTRRIVLEKAAAMHYKPNYMAKNLTKNRTGIIGVVVPEFVNSFFPRIIIQIQSVFESEGYRVLITQCDESWEAERRNLQLLEDSMVEGILISVTSKGKNSDYYASLLSRGIPIVFFNRADDTVDASSVTIDDYKWSFFATEHLIYTRKRMGQPSPRIMHFRGPEDIALSDRRFRGWSDALSKHHLEQTADSVMTAGAITIDEGARIMSSLIRKGAVPDAVFCFNDPLAIGAMKALGEAGIPIPDRISVMGFSESRSALVTTPQLSSVAQPLDEMGKTAARLLLGHIENPERKIARVILNASLNIRASSDPDKNMHRIGQVFSSL